MNSTWLSVLGLVAAAIITYIFAPILARRAEAKRQKRDELHRKAAKADEVSVEYNSLLFRQLEAMAEQHRIDMADVRQRLTESERVRGEQGKRIGELERQVTEFAAGLRVAVGYVLIPGPLWQEVRERLPDLPSTRFPGERVEVEPGHGGDG